MLITYKKNYKLIATDLSKQTKIKDPQQINFIGKIEGQDNGVTMFFIIEKSEETTFELLQNSVNILYSVTIILILQEVYGILKLIMQM